MNFSKILGAVWYTPPAPGIDAATHAAMQLPAFSVGVVAVGTGALQKQWKCYLGLGLGEDEEKETLNIAKYGVKVTKEVACAHFPNLDPAEFVF